MISLQQRVQELNALNQQLTVQRDSIDQNERFLRTLTDSLPGLVGYWDKQLRCRFANQHYQEWFGIPPERALGLPIHELLGRDLYEKNKPYLERAFAGEVQRFERDFSQSERRADPHRNPLCSVRSRWRGRGRSVLVSDITERKRTEEEVRALNTTLEQRVLDLRESEERFRLIFENALDAILISNTEGRMVLVNPKVGALFGYAPEELIGQPVEMLIPDHLRGTHIGHRNKYIAHPVPRGMGVVGTLQGRRKDGTLFPIVIGLSPLAFRDRMQIMGVHQRHHHQKQAEAERDEVLRKMTEAQKLESLWVLAGGIAHDFNNLLTGIMASASLMTSESRRWMMTRHR
jgi:PAS domain S-box-containing protein